jgi:hypothetical protein
MHIYLTSFLLLVVGLLVVASIMTVPQPSGDFGDAS